MSSEPTARDAWHDHALLLKLAVAAALSVGVVEIAPRTVSSGGDVPPARMLLVTATIIGIICSVLLFWGLRSDVGLPAKTAVYAVVFNVLVIVVKLGLAPRGFYEVNQRRNIDATFGTIDNGVMATLASATIFVLYLGVFAILYRSFRARIEHLNALDPMPRFGGRNVAIGFVILTVLLVASGGAILLLLLPLAGGLEYLDFVFSSSLSLVIAVLLACATAFAAMTFSSAADRARIVGDASIFMSFFWVGLYFLALYHVLWVVYVLVLTSIWPLKVVTPK